MFLKALKFAGVLLGATLIPASVFANAGYEGPGGGADQGIIAVYGTGSGGMPNPRARWNGRCRTCHLTDAGGGNSLTAFGNLFRGATLAERIRNTSQGTNANADSDGDGATNAAELQGCSDPFNPAQTPANLNPIPSHCLSTQTTIPPLPTLPPAQTPGSSRDQSGLGANSGAGGGTLTAGCGSKNNAAKASSSLWFLIGFPLVAWTLMRKK